MAPICRSSIGSISAITNTILEGGPYRPREPLTHGRLRALVLDLLFAAQLLREIGEEPSHSQFQFEDEDRLARSAPAWAEAVERVARVIEEAVDAGEDGEEVDHA